MAEQLTAGFFPDGSRQRGGHIRVFAWHAPEFGLLDPELSRRPKLFPIRSIIVERYVDENQIKPAVVRWSNGDYIQVWEVKGFRLGIRRRIERAISDTLRLAGAGRRTR